MNIYGHLIYFKGSVSRMVFTVNKHEPPPHTIQKINSDGSVIWLAKQSFWKRTKNFLNRIQKALTIKKDSKKLKFITAKNFCLFGKQKTLRQ